MKRTIIAIMFIFIFFACSCSKEPSQTQTAAPSPDSGSVSTPDINADVLLESVEKYNADTYWRDVYVPNQYLLYNGESIIYLLALDSLSQTTVIPISSVDSYKESSLGSVSAISIYSKSGDSISVTLSNSDAECLADILG